MKHRLGWAAVLSAALLLSAAGFYRWPLSSAFVASQIGARVWPAGVVMRGPGRASLSILPTPTLHLLDAEWDGPTGAAVLTAQRADIRLGAPALMAGRIEPAGVILRQPTAFIDLDTHTFGALTFDRTDPSVASEHWPGELTFQQGLIHVSSATRQIDDLIGDVEGSLSYAGPGSALGGNLRATWRDAPLAIALEMARPAQELDGATAASLSLAADQAWIKFDGEVLNNATLQGSFSVALPASTPLKRLFGMAKDSFVPLQDVALDGEVTANSAAIQLTQTHLSIGEQSFEGALTLELAPGRAALAGTLAGDTVNLDKFFANAPDLFDASGRWSEAPFRLPRFSLATVDLRLSAARISWRGHSLDNCAIALLGRDGDWTLSLLEASAYKGMLKGDLSMARRGEGLALRASANLANADFGSLLGEFGVGALTGQGGGELTLQAEGDSPAELLRGLNGEAQLRLAGGALEGVSFEEALRRSVRRSIDPASDMRMGRTVFTDANARFKIVDGKAQILAASLSGPGVNVSADGALDLIERRVEARAVAMQTDSGGAPTLDGPRVTFGLAGPWMAPAVAPGSGG
jgi:AsmA protein